jgi:branched-chain amino acid transport system ATP-binding protein
VSALLELKGVGARYGQVQALHGVDLVVEAGEIAAVLGANGAGKTTTLRAISGTVRRTGEVRFGGVPLRGGADTAARRGIAHVPEGRGTFAELTVAENLRLGAWTRRGDPSADEERVYELFPRLRDRLGQQAGTLSGGEQQMLALGRALMARPKLLLLDEPSLGLAPLVVQGIFAVLARLNEEEGLTVLVVEQNAALALRTAQRAFVLETGRVVLAGPADDLREHESIRRSYLGY